MHELLLPRLKREIEARLEELRPIVAEAERLEAAKAALLAEAAAERARGARNGAARNGRAAENGRAAVSANGAAAGATREIPVSAPTGAEAEPEDGRAPRGANQEAIIAIVEERPGVSVAEISSVTKIAKPTVATTVSKLKRDGVLADEAGGVKLASRQPLTLSQVAAAAPVREDGVSDEEWEAARRDAAA
jgi:hypothetical protein